MQSIPEKEAFRSYLEKSGIVDALTKGMVFSLFFVASKIHKCV